LTTIVTRAGKGSPLTNNEVDSNFTNLNTAKIETLTSTDTSVTITGTGSSRDLSVPINPDVVSGPASATDNAVARFDATTGKLIQNSVVTIDDAGSIENAIIDSFTNTVGADHIHYKIKANETIVKGNILKYVGWNAGEDAIEVVKVSSATDVAIGMAHDNLATGEFGLAVVVGTTEGFNTSAYTAGTILYPNTSGGLTATKPTSGTYQACAFVIRSQSVNGAYLVNFSNPVYVEASTNTANTAVIRDGSGNFSAGTITASLSGNATTATTLATGRTIAITGDLAYTSPAFNGSGNVTAAGTLATVNANVGSFTNASVTVNAKGLVTAASSGTAPVTSVSGTAPVVSSGGATPAISMAAATASVNGYMTSTYASKLDGIAAGATNVTNTNQLTNGAGFITSAGSCAYATSAGNADTVDGIHAATAGAAPGANQLVRTDGNGYTYTGWINTVSGDNGTTAIDRIYASSDSFLRYYSPTNFRTVLDVPTRGGSGASGTWGISITGSSASCTGNSATATTASTANALNSANSYTAVAFTATSDERLKTNWAGLSLDFVARLSDVKHGTFERINNGTRDVGVSAQSLQKLIPEAVVEDADGLLSVNYGGAALVAAIELAKQVQELRAEIAALKAKVGE